MKIEGETRAGDIQRLTEQKDSIESLAAHLAFKVEELERNPDNLLLPSYYNDISSSSSALTNSLTTAPKYKMPEIPPEFQKLADKASEFTREFHPLLRKMREFGVEFGELKTPEK